MESNLYSNVQALLKEIMCKRSSHKELRFRQMLQNWWERIMSGKLRWTLQKKLESSPSCCILLIQLLIKELKNCSVAAQHMNSEDNTQKVSKTDSHMHLIPLLHTIYYVITQSSAVIPATLYQTVYECLMKLIILPHPLSNVALSTLRSIKMEMITPGSLYQRRVISEQNLKNEYFALQEKVFVLADPAVCSATLEAAIREHLGGSSCLRDTSAMQKNVVLHVLQAGLEMGCQSSRVSQALEILGDQWIETYFQKLVQVVEESIEQGAGGHDNYLLKLKDIYRDIVTASTEEIPPEDQDSVFATPMPFPEIQFITWRNENDLWDLLFNFALHYCPNSSIDEESNRRNSAESNDSKIERNHCNNGENPLDRNPMPALNRRKAIKNMNAADKLTAVKEKMEAISLGSPVPKDDRKRHTARIVVMGDDRVLGRLTRAYHSIRERESKRLFLTKRLNLQLYYIPLTDVETSLSPADDSRFSLSAFLGQVDPWYDCNINGLQASVSKLYEMHCKNIKPSKHNLFLLDTLCYYLRCGSQHVNLPLYSVKMTRSSSEGGSVVEDVFVSHLEADIPEFRHLREKSSEMQFGARGKKSFGVFGASISVSYTKMSLSKREAVKGEAPMACGVVITSEPTAVTSGENYLTVRFDCLIPERNTEIHTQSISIKTVACRTLSVCLDRDPRRTYKDIQRMEISQCEDPGNNIRTGLRVSTKQEPLLRKYLEKVLSLPINTFSSVTP